MKLALASLFGMALASPVAAAEQASAVTVEPSKTLEGPKDWFTGKVKIQSQFQRTDPARVSGALVTFEPGARTAWHTHPLGQSLLVISGEGRVQQWGGPVQTIKQGDTVWIPPGVKHWHGAGPKTSMSHVAVQESQNGKVVDWMEQVSDEQYQH